MSQSQTQHAHRVVESFKQKLSKSGIEHVGQKHFEELQLLIESAIDNAVFMEMEKIVGKLEHLTQEVKVCAERFD